MQFPQTKLTAQEIWIMKIESLYNGMIKDLETPIATSSARTCFELHNHCGVTSSSGIAAAIEALENRQASGKSSVALRLLQMEWTRYWTTLSSLDESVNRWEQERLITFKNVFEVFHGIKLKKSDFPRLMNIQNGLSRNIQAGQIQSSFYDLAKESKAGSQMRKMARLDRQMQAKIFWEHKNTQEFNIDDLRYHADECDSTELIEAMLLSHYKEKHLFAIYAEMRHAMNGIVEEATASTHRAIAILRHFARHEHHNKGECLVFECNSCLAKCAGAVTRALKSLLSELRSIQDKLKKQTFEGSDAFAADQPGPHFWKNEGRKRPPSRSRMSQVVQTLATALQKHVDEKLCGPVAGIQQRMDETINKAQTEIDEFEKTLQRSVWMPLQRVLIKLAMCLDVVHGLWENANTLVKPPIALTQVLACSLTNTLRAQLGSPLLFLFPQEEKEEKEEKEKENPKEAAGEVSSVCLRFLPGEEELVQRQTKTSLFLVSFATCWVVQNMLGKAEHI
jgi:hypothetical protein